MKKFLLKTVLVILIAGTAYALFFSTVKIGAGMVCVVEDLRSKKTVAIARPLAGDFAFIWQGAFPWWFLVSEMPSRRTIRHDARITIPGLEGLKEPYYCIGVPLRITYRIDPARFTDARMLGHDGSGVDEMVGKLFERGLQRELSPFLAPVYQRDNLAAQAESAVAGLAGSLEKELGDEGLSLSGARILGILSLPDRQVYNEGIAHAADLRNMDKIVEKSLIEVRNGMERDKIQNEQFFGKLKEISKIIAANPDILKYIYIDKMAGNVKVILSSDNSGVPGMLEKEMKPSKAKPREIDNLR